MELPEFGKERVGDTTVERMEIYYLLKNQWAASDAQSFLRREPERRVSRLSIRCGVWHEIAWLQQEGGGQEQTQREICSVGSDSAQNSSLFEICVAMKL